MRKNVPEGRGVPVEKTIEGGKAGMILNFEQIFLFYVAIG